MSPILIAMFFIACISFLYCLYGAFNVEDESKGVVMLLMAIVLGVVVGIVGTIAHHDWMLHNPVPVTKVEIK